MLIARRKNGRLKPFDVLRKLNRRPTPLKETRILDAPNLKFTMLFTLNYIKETMYYWGVNSKMQTSHTLCSRPKRYCSAACGLRASPARAGASNLIVPC